MFPSPSAGFPHGNSSSSSNKPAPSPPPPKRDTLERMMRFRPARILLYLIGGVVMTSVVLVLRPGLVFQDLRSLQGTDLNAVNMMKHSFRGREQVYRERRHLVSTICGKLRSSPRTKLPGGNSLRHILVDDVNKVMYCEIPKVGSTNWKWTLLHSSGKINAANLSRIDRANVHNGRYTNSLRNLGAYTPLQRHTRISTYFKFMVVRNPLERLLSTYLDKFTARSHDRYFLQKFGRYIIRTYRTKPNELDLKTGRGVSFREFLRFVIDSYRKRIPLDRHWRTYQDLCHPCYVDYDVIARYGDSLGDDVAVILDWLNIKPQLAKTFGIPDTKRTANKMKRFYQDVPLRSIHRLSKVYETDLLMFNYTDVKEHPSWSESLKSIVQKYFHWKP
ncbi:carbohydrate sulfotransferase 11-like [Tubulanus polymorphus]|uniref:carbohydrate sulfotransferase 11-like n=1 Tax=Tubulanus polymorphus TaxID=672921 RepID=UPI003DA64019